MALRTEMTIIIFTIAASTLGIGYWQWRRRRKVFVKVGKVKSLYHIPVKSLSAVEVSEIECTSYGAVSNGVLDRTFMLVTDEGVLISQREEPSLVLLTPKVSGDSVIISGGGKDPLKIPVKDTISPGEKVVMARVHSDELPVVDCGEEPAKWFQDYLKRSDVRVVRYAKELPVRQYTKNDPTMAKLKKAYPVYLHDESPFHIVAESSIVELNTKTETKVSVLNFRPNILVEGSEAFDEDNWKYLSFSSGVEFVTTLPCSRCVLTTNDPQTAIKTNKEPLVALRKFRMPKDPALAKTLRYSPCFGIFGSLVKPGHVKVGDDVYAVISKGLFKF